MRRFAVVVILEGDEIRDLEKARKSAEPWYMVVAELKRSVMLSRAQITRMEQVGLFPKRIYVGPGRIVWKRVEVLAWMQDKIDRRPLDGTPRLTIRSGDRFIAKRELLKIVPYSGNYFWDLERKGKFPKRIQLCTRRSGWLEREVVEWLAQKGLQQDDRGSAG